jgi:hypothetical protein
MPGNITKSLSNRSLDEINPEEVLECFNDGKNAPLKIGNYMYLIAHNWADQLKKWAELSGENPNAYATTAPLYSPATNGIPGLTKYGSPNSTVSILENGTPSSRPGPIDNRLLVDETTGQMKADLQDESDYVMVDEYHWQKFVSW